MMKSPLHHWTRRALLRMLTCCALILASSAAQPQRSSAQSAGLVSIGDRSLSLNCTGSGSPVIWLMSGYGGGTHDWEKIQPIVARQARVCSYDRAGEGASDPAPNPPYDADDVARDFDDLLTTIGLAEPIILVGWSIGGTLARYFAAEHPDQIVGLILVDPTPPEWPSLKLAMSRPEVRGAKLRELTGYDENVMEPLDTLQIGIQAIASPELHIPVIMLTAGIKTLSPIDLGEQDVARILRHLQAEQAVETHAIHKVLSLCTHQIPSECPDDVIEAIEIMLFLTEDIVTVGPPLPGAERLERLDRRVAA